MKYIRQMLVILGFSVAGELLHHWIPLPIPASIYGMVLLFGCLVLKIVPADWVKDTGGFLVTLLPLIIVFMLTMGMDSMMGLGVCLLAACFGFSAAITNPFSVGIASQYAGIHTSSGIAVVSAFSSARRLLSCS